MSDQAFKLRQMVEHLRTLNAAKTKQARIITVTSGKGGVGKSNFTANLAISLRVSGYRVLVLDADFGLSNIDVILGIQSPWNFSHVLSGQKALKDIIAEGPGGIQVISGGSGIYELISMAPAQIDRVLADIPAIEPMADIILIDTGAGVSEQVMKMVRASQEVVLITTPEPTAVMDAYALLKTLTAVPAGQLPKLYLVVNKAENQKEAEGMLDSFTSVARRFLKLPLEKLGYLPSDPNVSRSVKSQVPFVLNNPKSPAAKGLKDIAITLLNENRPASAPGQLLRFFRRLTGML